MKYRIESFSIPRPGTGGISPARVLVTLAVIFMIFIPVGSPASVRCAFDTLEIYAGAVANTNKNEYHDFWNQGEGVEAYALTSFYAGDIELGLRYVLNSGRTPATPDYSTTTVYCGWSYPLRITPWIVFHPGVSVANNIMYFDTEKRFRVDLETEIGAALFTRLGIRLYGQWHANVTGRWTTMFTHRRIGMVFFSAGISRQLSMPGWLRGFLE